MINLVRVNFAAEIDREKAKLIIISGQQFEEGSFLNSILVVPTH